SSSTMSKLGLSISDLRFTIYDLRANKKWNAAFTPPQCQKTTVNLIPVYAEAARTPRSDS
ncbi:MAG: hypothetical protein ABJC04_12425, partial [Verrucomicrobiota bacterium]